MDRALVDGLGLHAVDGGLHGGVGVLHAKRGAAGAEHAEGQDLLGVEVARINLDTDLGTGAKVKSRCTASANRVSWSAGKKVGVPPPRWSWVTGVRGRCGGP